MKIITVSLTTKEFGSQIIKYRKSTFYNNIMMSLLLGIMEDQKLLNIYIGIIPYTRYKWTSTTTPKIAIPTKE
jgi:hypothetical protein